MNLQLFQWKTYKLAALAYSLLFLILTVPYWGCGEVIAPHCQFLELATVDNTGTRQLENRKFSDFTSCYIPEISEHLIGLRSGWLALWTNKNELGRPLYQISGFSPAYLGSWLIAQCTKNPWRFITIVSLLNCFFSGIFIILFCRENHLSPLAGLVAGISLAAAPPLMYWLTFPMFLSAWCWASCALWAITRLAKKTDFLGWSALAFSSYSLLMTAYPQLIVYHAYLLGAYTLYLMLQKPKITSLKPLRFLTLIASALIIGIITALPVYRDLANLYFESARTSPDVSFFTTVLPKFANASEIARFYTLCLIPEIFGNPISSTFPFFYDGCSITLLVVFFTIVGLLASFKKTWFWGVATMLFCLFSFVHPLYLFGLKFLKFNISRVIPFSTSLLPFLVIAAYGVDALVMRTKPVVLSKIVLVAATCILAIIFVGISYHLFYLTLIRWNIVLVMLVMTFLLAAQYNKIRSLLLFAALISSLIISSYPLMLYQNPAAIATISPLVEKMKANLPADSRFAIALPGIGILPPNLTATLGLSSIHSYNSLSPKRYHALIESLGGKMETYGRWNGAISPDYESTMFWMSNISLILSPLELTHKNLEYLDKISGVYLFKVKSSMGEAIQLILPQRKTIKSIPRFADLQSLSTHSPIKQLDQGDILEFEVIPENSSLFILSQKFSYDWHAQILDQNGWKPAKTTEVNGVFQGVLLPPETQRVRLEFKPFVRFAWMAHIFWALLFLLLVVQFLRKRHKIVIS